MKTRFSKFLAVALALIMVITALPVSALPVTGSGDAGRSSASKYPAQSFTSELEGGLTVTVEAPEGALPAKTKMTAAIVDNDAVQSAVDQTSGVSGSVLAAVDITFKKGNTEIQPKKDVVVTISSDALDGMDDISVVHLDVSADELTSSDEAELVGNVQNSKDGVSFAARSFSVYAVIGGGQSDIKFLTVTFLDKDGQTVINKQKIRQDQIPLMDPVVYDPGVPSLTSTQAFTGWGTEVPGSVYVEGAGISVDDINAKVLNEYAGWDRDMEFEYIAQVFNVTYIFYCDQYGAVYKTDIKPVGGEFTYDTTYVAEGPEGSNVGVVGWVRFNDFTYVEKVGEGTELPEYTDAAPAEAAARVPGETDTVNGELILFPYITAGHWVTFDSNTGSSSDPNYDPTRADYTAPRFVSDGEALAKPTDPNRPGYTFDGWFTDQACTTPFKFSGEAGAVEVNSNITLYAKWTGNQVNYTVVVWTQNADDTLDSNQLNGNDDTNNEYDYKDMTGVSGFDGTQPATAGTVLSALPSGYDALGGTKNSALGYYFVYNRAKTIAANGNPVIKGDGSTVINIYYDRKVITYRFGTGTMQYYPVSNPDWSSGKTYYVRTGSAYSGYTYLECFATSNYYYTEYTGSLYQSTTYYILYNNTVYEYYYRSANGSFVFYYNGSYYTWSGTVYTRSTSAPSSVYEGRMTLDSVTKTSRGLYGALLDDGDWPSAGSGYVWSNYDEGAYTVFDYPLALSEYVPTWQNGAVTTQLDFYKSSFSTDVISVINMGQRLGGGTGANDFTERLATGSVSRGGTWHPSETTRGFTVYGYRFGTSGSWTSCNTESSISVSSSASSDLYVAFTRNHHSLTFISKGVEQTSVSKSAVYYDEPLSTYKPADSFVPNNAATGEYFTGWYKNPECTEKFDWTGKMPDHDVAVYAGWSNEWYRIVFDATGNPNVPANTIIVPGANQTLSFCMEYGKKIGDSGLTKLTTTVPGYTFGGWFYDAAHTIPFNFDTEIGPEIPTASNSKMDMGYKDLPDSQRSGSYVITNMNNDGTLNGPRTVTWSDAGAENSGVRGKLTLYGLWRKKVAGASGISVIYDAVEGKGIIRSPYPEEVVKPDPILYTDGAVAFGRYAATPTTETGADDEVRQFLYWEIRDKQGNVLYKVYPGQPFPVDIDWAEETNAYNVTWHYKGPDGSDIDDHTKVAEGMIPTHATPPSYVADGMNHVFVEWTPAVAAAHDDAEYTAVYNTVDIEHFTVSYADSLDNNAVFASEDVVQGAYPLVNVTVPAHNGKRFIGWYMNGGTTLLSTDEVKTTAIIAATTFTAQYEDAGYTVTFDANGGTFANGSSTTTIENVAAGTRLSTLFPATNPTHATSGNYFYGWFTDSTGGTEVSGTSTATVTGNVTLHAHWFRYRYVADTTGAFVAGERYAFVHTYNSTDYFMANTTNGSDLTKVEVSGSVPTTAQWVAVADTEYEGYFYFQSVKSTSYYFGVDPNYTTKYCISTSASDERESLTLSDAGSSKYYLQWDKTRFVHFGGTYYTITTDQDTPFTVYHRTVVDQNAAKSPAIRSFDEIEVTPAVLERFKPTKVGETVTMRDGTTWEKATSIAAGDVVIIVCDTQSVELSGFGGTSTRYGTTSSYSTTPAGAFPLDVVAGYSSGTYSFRGRNSGYTSQYLYWSSANSLYYNSTHSANTSWNVSFDSNGNATITNSANSARKLQYNASYTRFACYTSTQTNIQIYKQVNDTPATPCTVTYMANGAEYGNATVNSGSTTTLPFNATEITGYEFIGWTTSTWEEQTTAPTFYEGGAQSPVITGDTTFYALYRRIEGGDTVYELLTSTPTDWSGNYVITGSQDTSNITLAVMAGLANGQSYEDDDILTGDVALADTGIVYDATNNRLSNVASQYVFTIASYSTGYSIRNNDTYTYLQNNGGYLYATNTLGTNTAFTLSRSGNNVVAYNSTDSYGYGYLAYLNRDGNESLKFFGMWNSAPSSIYFWRENVLGTTYYTTGASTFTVTWKDANGSVIETDTGVELGSHPSFDGTNPTKPADGTYTYTFAGWKVEGTSGDTTVDLSTYTVTGNVTFVPVFTATEIPTVTYTVTYRANGSVINTEDVAAASTVTLPATAPAATGYEFIGWMTYTLEETTNEPAYKAPGAVSDPINADTTFYALYRRTEGTTETVFELLTAVPQNVPGTYVISSGATTSDYMLSTRRSGTYESASYTTLISDAEATISVENGKTIMRNVPADNQFTFAAGSESGYYTIVNNSGSYLYIADPTSTNAYYLAARTSYTNTYSLWSLEYTDGVFHVGSYSNSDRVFHYSTSASLFGLYSVGGNSSTIGVQLWKQTEIASGETFYTTETGSTHKLTVNYVVPNGYTAPESFVEYYAQGDTYTVESPVIEGLTPDQATVNGEMGSEDVTVTVTYSVTPTFTLTIEYIGPDGDEDFPTPASAVMQVAAGAAYSVGSPWVYGYQADQEVVSGTMPNENTTIRVYYTKVDMGDKTYTITLYAVYGRANKEGNTHIYWYSNDYDADETTGGRCHEDILDINEPVAIPAPGSFTPGTIDWTQTNPSVLSREGGDPLVWADHIFLGWARVEAALDDITGKAHPELSDADLYLKWTGSEYQVETKDGWTSVEQVAADEMLPYHDMYAVWADVFYVYHSGTNAVERVVRTSRATTYNLARTVSSGMLYGGYYKAYAGMSANFNIKNDPAWEDVSVDQIIASYRGIVRQTTKTVNGESVLYKDTAGTAYNGVNETWNWDESYNIDTVTTQGATKEADPHGNAIKPVAGETYFIKEVPADKYLMPHLHFTYYLDAEQTITRFWLVSNIDDVNYQQGGFAVTNGDDTVLYSSTDYVPQLTIFAQTNDEGKDEPLTPNGLFGAEGGYLTYKRFETSELHEGMVLRNYWVTPDGMIVLGANKITLGNTANVGSLVAGTVIELNTPSTVSVFANNAN